MSTTPTYNLNPENWQEYLAQNHMDKDGYLNISFAEAERIIDSLLAAKEQEKNRKFVEDLNYLKEKCGNYFWINQMIEKYQEYKQGRPNQE